MLGDPEVMAFYPRPTNVEEAQAWIEWNKANYKERGYGPWIIETKSGQFVGDCGLTWQAVNERLELEVGYHVRSIMPDRARERRPDHASSRRPVATLPTRGPGIRTRE